MELATVFPTTSHVSGRVVVGPLIEKSAVTDAAELSSYGNTGLILSQSSDVCGKAIPSTQIFVIGLPGMSVAEDPHKPEVDTLSSTESQTNTGHSSSVQVTSIVGGDAGKSSRIEQQKRGDGNNISITVEKMAERGQRHVTERARRLVTKGGECNVKTVGITHRRRMYLADLFTTLIEMRWRYQVAIVTAQFAITWLLFGAVYYVIAVVRGDILHSHNVTLAPCIVNISDYASAVFFSMETQTTIGYGNQVPDPMCPIGMFVVMIQCCIGIVIQMLATGIFFTKISRPKGRAKTLMFSRNAVICLRDGQYQLMFRVGDMRHKSHIIGTSIRALMVRNRLTADGELIPMCQYPLALSNETSPVNDNFLFMVWPLTVAHKIDISSPLWDISAEQFLEEKFELIIIVEGTVELTGSSTQVRTSYLPSEIIWGRRHAPLLTYGKENGCYTINFERFHELLTVPMPNCSAKLWSTLPTTHTLNHLGLAVTSENQADFKTDIVERVPQARRIIDKIFRRRATKASDNQCQIRRLQAQKIKETDSSSIVSVAVDSSRSTTSLGEYSLQPRSDI